jgi:branched-chain amino acid transport system permease protein
VFTLALGVILTISIERWESVTGGTDGLIGIPAAIGTIAFTSLVAQYYLVLVFLALTIYLSVSIAQSLVGRSFIAIARARIWRAIGIDVGRTMRLSFVISATFAGLAGVLYASHLGYIGRGMLLRMAPDTSSMISRPRSRAGVSPSPFHNSSVDFSGPSV